MFKQMFDDIDGYATRSERNLKRYYTTSPQAEVLIYNEIEIEFIDKIVFKNSEVKSMYQNVVPQFIKCEVIPDYFYTREDHEFGN